MGSSAFTLGSAQFSSVAAALGYPGANAAVIGSANLFAVRVWLPFDAVFTRYLFRVATASGNMDLGVYDAAGVAIRREGSFAVPAAGAGVRVLAGGALALVAGEYLIALQVDNSTVSLGLIGTNQLQHIAYTPTNTFPLPASFALTVGGTAHSVLLAP